MWQPVGEVCSSPFLFDPLCWETDLLVSNQFVICCQSEYNYIVSFSCYWSLNKDINNSSLLLFHLGLHQGLSIGYRQRLSQVGGSATCIFYLYIISWRFPNIAVLQILKSDCCTCICDQWLKLKNWNQKTFEQKMEKQKETQKLIKAVLMPHKNGLLLKVSSKIQLLYH